MKHPPAASFQKRFCLYFLTQRAYKRREALRAVDCARTLRRLAREGRAKGSWTKGVFVSRALRPGLTYAAPAGLVRVGATVCVGASRSELGWDALLRKSRRRHGITSGRRGRIDGRRAGLADIEERSFVAKNAPLDDGQKRLDAWTVGLGEADRQRILRRKLRSSG